MRSLIRIAALVADFLVESCLCVHAQIWWEHRIVVRGLEGTYAGNGRSCVNSSGVPTFAGTTPDSAVVYRGSENLSQLVGRQVGVAEGINDAGQVVWQGGGAIWVYKLRISDGLVPDASGYGISVAAVCRGLLRTGGPSDSGQGR